LNILNKLKPDEGRITSPVGVGGLGDCTGFDFFKYTLIYPLVRIYNSRAKSTEICNLRMLADSLQA